MRYALRRVYFCSQSHRLVLMSVILSGTAANADRLITSERVADALIVEPSMIDERRADGM